MRYWLLFFFISVTQGALLGGLKEAQGLFECKARFSVPLRDIENIKNNHLPRSRGGKCMVACLMKKMNLMTDDGSVSADGMKALVSEKSKGKPNRLNRSYKIIDQCISKLSKGRRLDECEMAVRMTDCTMKKAKELSSNRYKV